MLRDLFPNGQFAEPASEADIFAVEQRLSCRFPAQLRELFLETDGFREDLGNAKYLLSLTDEDSIGSLLRTTDYYWNEVQISLLRSYVFFGSSSADEKWGISVDGADRLIAYHHHMGDEVEHRGTRIVELYKADYALYSEIK